METGTESYYSSFDTLIRTTLFVDIFARKIFARKLIRAKIFILFSNFCFYCGKLGFSQPSLCNHLSRMLNTSFDLQRRENDRKIKNFKIPAHNCCIAPGIKTKNPTTLNLTINEPILESLQPGLQHMVNQNKSKKIEQNPLPLYP